MKTEVRKVNITVLFLPLVYLTRVASPENSTQLGKKALEMVAIMITKPNGHLLFESVSQ
jgi:hypothetical protein